jgi:pimeloyl-ACP methyl ester carboxylesterase
MTPNEKTADEHVVLVHGLWMRGFTLMALRKRLERDGFSVDTFDYASVFHSPIVSTEKLLKRAHLSKSKKIHFVGHSLGGLMVLQALQKEPELATGRVVCLGTPLRGSAVARGLSKLPGGSFVIGKNLNILSDGIERWTGKHEVGAIAGRLPYGFGVAVGGLSSPHDGTVSVEETKLPGLTDHCIVDATHSGLPFSDEAATQTIIFLRSGRFQSDETGRRTSAA